MDSNPGLTSPQFSRNNKPPSIVLKRKEKDIVAFLTNNQITYLLTSLLAMKKGPLEVNGIGDKTILKHANVTHILFSQDQI